MTTLELEEKSGVANGAISQYENDKKVPKHDNLAKLAAALGVTVGYFFDEPPAAAVPGQVDRSSWTMHTIPVFTATVHAGEFQSAPSDHVDRYIEVPSGLCPDPQAGAVEVVGDCMAPMFEAGDLVFFSDSYRIKSGDVVLVGLDDEQIAIRKIQFPKDDDEHALLLCVNPRHQPRLVKRAEIKVCKKVIASHRSLI